MTDQPLIPSMAARYRHAWDYARARYGSLSAAYNKPGGYSGPPCDCDQPTPRDGEDTLTADDVRRIASEVVVEALSATVDRSRYDGPAFARVFLNDQDVTDIKRVSRDPGDARTAHDPEPPE